LTSEQVLLTERSEGVWTLTLNRPKVLNALDARLTSALRAALESAVQADDCRCLLLNAAGRGFCSGADLGSTSLREREAADTGAIESILEERFHPIVRLLRDAPFPLVCAVNGVAAGAGMSLAMAFDMVLAARSASFAQSFSRLGLVQDAGSSYYLPRAVGRPRAWGMALGGEPVDGPTAERWGLIWRCVEDDELAGESRSLAASLAARPTRGIALLRKVMHEGLGNGLDEQLCVEARHQALATRTEDFREALAAFVAKRPPRFSGR
jgi:2-(1,2-epoxy-1,2-dihydrophenyl)acetyl-CoA isomerase